jgi:hypothetical protein
MPKPNRVPRSKEDLKNELNDQLEILRTSCIAFDNGAEAVGKSIATSLRVLLYSHKQSRGLLDQLGYRSDKFISSCEKFDENNIAPRINLLAINVTSTAVTWIPKATDDPQCVDSRKLAFVDWWSEIIARDGMCKTFSRMDLVMNVADTDGGAHVDPDLVESYMDLTRGNSLGYKFGEKNIPFVGRPVLTCMRQIAHEVIATLRANAPELGDRVSPVVPPDREPAEILSGGQSIQIVGNLPEKFRGMDNLQGTATMNPTKKLR